MLRALFKFNARPGKAARLILPGLPYVGLLVAYAIFAAKFQAENPGTQLIPDFSQLVDGISRYALPNEDGESRMLLDAWATMRNLLIAILINLTAVIVGLYMGLFPYINLTLRGFFIGFDKFVMIMMLPVLLVWLGFGDVMRIGLTVLGTYFSIGDQMRKVVEQVERQKIYTGVQLGASDFQLANRILLPYLLPRALLIIQDNLKPMLTLLLAAEMPAGEYGIGRRAFVLKRWQEMSVIIPYVLWAALLTFLLYIAFDLIIKYGMRWFERGEAR